VAAVAHAAPRWRIGITQRRLPATATAGERDALDADWSEWFAAVFPQALHIPIPNFLDARRAIGFARDCCLDALLLSGGEDVGSSPVRDAVERALLAEAAAAGWPVLGVCRGMQLLQLASDGRLQATDGHCAGAHRVSADGHGCEVNSWHRWQITEAAPQWRVLARADDGSIEAMMHNERPWLGLMWHPERADPGASLWRPWLATLFPAATVGSA
jgi:N5-(cytidine 5'-diphosphoramidyl)-L-glutamine hydrolase